ncbi:DUF1330 domain-containing protein [Salaquimonas pukyongi]|uniref:DUF1330 domain-containing protein n=1 Tax=Salaquimonas pukyongi TaxID=2712698 RepID=UPI00096BCED2|nr:DUF1330 domain-containing protein [Salaquimonas pukyongi]
MSAYIVVRVDVTDAEKWKEYAAAAGPVVARFGGKYLARGGEMADLENSEDEGKRVVVLQFADMETAKAWYNSDEYQAAKTLREGAGHARFTLVDGYEG